MGRARKIFAATCVVSLLVHLGLLSTVGRWWDLPREEVSFPLEARLDQANASPLPPEVIATPVSPTTTEPPKPIPSPPPQVEATDEPEPPRVSGTSAPPPFPAPVSVPVPASESVPEPAPEPTPTLVPEPPEVKPAPPPPVAAPEAPTKPRRIARALPEKLVLVYNVLAGEGGFKLGQATYTWQVKEDHYRLESVAQASGLASLFVSGSIVQTSAGRIGDNGLIPELFSQSKSERRQDTARFDWGNKQLYLPNGGEVLRKGTQDLLSFPFHLAMTVAEGNDAWQMPVTNGRKLKDYLFQVVGREHLEMGREQVDTLHVQGGRTGEGTLDVWLAPGRHWLPQRIRTQDQKGKVIVLNLVPGKG